MSQPFFWRVFEPRAGTFEEVQQADVEKNAHNFIIGQIFSPWRLHLWDTHKATAALTLPPQPSGGTHQMIRGLFMHRSSSSTDPWVSIRAI
jgi:hypothetical protein